MTNTALISPLRRAFDAFLNGSACALVCPLISDREITDEEFLDIKRLIGRKVKSERIPSLRDGSIPNSDDQAKPRHYGFIRSSLFINTLLAIVLIFYFFDPITYFRTMQSKAWIEDAESAEQKVFSGSGMEYVVNHISLINRDESSNLRCWIPIAQPNRGGEVELTKLYLPLWNNAPPRNYCLTDQIWLDSNGGQFARILTDGMVPVFGYSFDGKYLYTFNRENNKGIQKIEVLKTFKFPAEKRVELLGILAGLPTSFTRIKQNRSKYLGEEKIYNSGRTRVFLVNPVGSGGMLESEYQLKLRKSDHAIAEITCRIGKTQIAITRLRTGTTTRPPEKWDLSNLY